jgi:8-oxo-dGTP pyrophosphatase MutT (NUDIX family)
MTRCGIILSYNKYFETYYLIVYSKKSKKWGFPKGGAHENESYKDTALREFYEETGYKFIYSKKMSKKFQYRNNLYFIVYISCPEKELIETDIPDSDEILEKKWIAKQDLLKIEEEKCNMGLKQWILFLNKKNSLNKKIS